MDFINEFVFFLLTERHLSNALGNAARILFLKDKWEEDHEMHGALYDEWILPLYDYRPLRGN